MTVDTEKIKALALAATQGARRWWACRDGDHDYVQIAAGPEHIAQIRIRTLTEADLNFLIATDPAAVLELIAEVERLRAEVAVQAARSADPKPARDAAETMDHAQMQALGQHQEKP